MMMVLEATVSVVAVAVIDDVRSSVRTTRAIVC